MGCSRIAAAIHNSPRRSTTRPGRCSAYARQPTRLAIDDLDTSERFLAEHRDELTTPAAIAALAREHRAVHVAISTLARAGRADHAYALLRTPDELPAALAAARRERDPHH